MIHEVLTAEQFAPALAGKSGAVLKTYARPQEGFLAEEGGRWGVIVLPGGGYQVNAKSEGEPIALAFLGAGVQAFLLEYSVAPARWPQALLETASAIAWLRENAGRYGVAPDKIAVCGFSAGGHLAGCAANLWNSPVVETKLGLTGEQARPDAAILCYPVITMGRFGSDMTRSNLFGGEAVVKGTSLEQSVTDRNPPTFLWATYTDGSVPVENSLLYANALRSHDVPFELHIFGKGPHAMGLATGESAWQADHTDAQASVWHPLCVSWLKGLK
ncbi:MAG: alpha/beta hydrolase [Oscillospiraceae bacterium]